MTKRNLALTAVIMVLVAGMAFALGRRSPVSARSAPVSAATPAVATTPAAAVPTRSSLPNTKDVADIELLDSRHIPEIFRGRWVSDLDSCATPDDMNDVNVEPDGYHDIQTSAKLKHVSKTGPRSLHLQFTEEDGGARESSYVEDWSLDAAGSQLTQIVYYDGPGTNRLLRCR